ncbi:hypothetical protein F5Y15DRAFT_416742 [Xylariaceae sp. FL0016]|nr:hypothetical protein F5Y15DRAFT_416742 [Xylariaceae sp. FL0016]
MAYDASDVGRNLVEDLLNAANIEEQDANVVRALFARSLSPTGQNALANQALTSIVAFLHDRKLLSTLHQMTFTALFHKLDCDQGVEEKETGRPLAIEWIDQSGDRRASGNEGLYHFHEIFGTKHAHKVFHVDARHDIEAAKHSAQPHPIMKKEIHDVRDYDKNEQGTDKGPRDYTTLHGAVGQPVQRINRAFDKVANGQVKFIDVRGGAIDGIPPSGLRALQEGKIDYGKKRTRLVKTYPYAERLLSKMGWQADQGLGADGHGLKEPINHRDYGNLQKALKSVKTKKSTSPDKTQHRDAKDQGNSITKKGSQPLEQNKTLDTNSSVIEKPTTLSKRGGANAWNKWVVADHRTQAVGAALMEQDLNVGWMTKQSASSDNPPKASSTNPTAASSVNTKMGSSANSDKQSLAKIDYEFFSPAEDAKATAIFKNFERKNWNSSNHGW